MGDTAIVQTATSELIAAAKRIHGDLAMDERVFAEAGRSALANALQLGRVLAQLKAGCGRGEYYPALEQIGVSPQRASECVRLARATQLELAGCESLREALARVKEQPPAPEVAGPAVAVAEVVEGVVAQAERYPGDDTEEIEEEKAAPKNGAPLADWKDCQRRIDGALRVPDDLARAYGTTVKEKGEFRLCMEAVTNAAKAFEALRQKMVR